MRVALLELILAAVMAAGMILIAGILGYLYWELGKSQFSMGSTVCALGSLSCSRVAADSYRKLRRR